jgi:hypothetical protein
VIESCRPDSVADGRERLTRRIAMIADFMGEDFRMHSHGAKLTPARARHAFGEAHLVPGQWLVLPSDLQEQRLKMARGFAFDEESL